MSVAIEPPRGPADLPDALLKITFVAGRGGVAQLSPTQAPLTRRLFAGAPPDTGRRPTAEVLLVGAGLSQLAGPAQLRAGSRLWRASSALDLGCLEAPDGGSWVHASRRLPALELPLPVEVTWAGGDLTLLLPGPLPSVSLAPRRDDVASRPLPARLEVLAIDPLRRLAMLTFRVELPHRGDATLVVDVAPRSTRPDATQWQRSSAVELSAVDADQARPPPPSAPAAAGINARSVARTAKAPSTAGSAPALPFRSSAASAAPPAAAEPREDDEHDDGARWSRTVKAPITPSSSPALPFARRAAVSARPPSAPSQEPHREAPPDSDRSGGSRTVVGTLAASVPALPFTRGPAPTLPTLPETEPERDAPPEPAGEDWSRTVLTARAQDSAPALPFTREAAPAPPSAPGGMMQLGREGTPLAYPPTPYVNRLAGGEAETTRAALVASEPAGEDRDTERPPPPAVAPVARPGSQPASPALPASLPSPAAHAPAPPLHPSPVGAPTFRSSVAQAPTFLGRDAPAGYAATAGGTSRPDPFRIEGVSLADFATVRGELLAAPKRRRAILKRRGLSEVKWRIAERRWAKHLQDLEAKPAELAAVADELISRRAQPGAR